MMVNCECRASYCAWCENARKVTPRVKAVKDEWGGLLERLYEHFSEEENYNNLLLTQIYAVQVSGGWKSGSQVFSGDR